MEESDEEQAGLFILGPEYYEDSGSFSNEFLINLSMISLRNNFLAGTTTIENEPKDDSNPPTSAIENPDDFPKTNQSAWKARTSSSDSSSSRAVNWAELVAAAKVKVSSWALAEHPYITESPEQQEVIQILRIDRPPDGQNWGHDESRQHIFEPYDNFSLPDGEEGFTCDTTLVFCSLESIVLNLFFLQII